MYLGRRVTRKQPENPRNPATWSPRRKERFWLKVRVSGADDCWPWLGRIGSKGIGRYGIRVAPKVTIDVYAPRAAWILTHGALRPRMEVFHVCPHLSCVNPRHLGAGRPVERVAHAKARGRIPAGASHHAAKLTPTQVRAIRALKVTQPSLRAVDLAGSLGISISRLQALWRGEGWQRDR